MDKRFSQHHNLRIIKKYVPMWFKHMHIQNQTDKNSMSCLCLLKPKMVFKVLGLKGHIILIKG